jgi:hypothetical protein
MTCDEKRCAPLLRTLRIAVYADVLRTVARNGGYGVNDTRDGIERYLNRTPKTCFV